MDTDYPGIAASAEIFLDRRFIPFIEKNEHEGETWVFYLQVDGNEEELNKLRVSLSKWAEKYDDNIDYPEFSLSDDIVSEQVVNGRVGAIEDDDSYMEPYHKVTGKFTCPTIDLDNFYSITDRFYKGKIRNFFQDVEETRKPVSLWTIDSLQLDPTDMKAQLILAAPGLIGNQLVVSFPRCSLEDLPQIDWANHIRAHLDEAVDAVMVALRSEVAQRSSVPR